MVSEYSSSLRKGNAYGGGWGWLDSGRQRIVTVDTASIVNTSFKV